MARTANGPHPYYKSSRSCWYVMLPKAGGGREDIRLDPDAAKATTQFHRIMAQRGDATPTAVSSSTTVRDLIAQFLVWSESNDKPRTTEHYRFYLTGQRGFAAAVPAMLKVADLKPYHVTNWISRQWPGKPFNLYGAVKRPFSWARREGYIEQSPLANLKKPPAGGRGGDADAYIPRDEFSKILAAIKSQEFKDYCEFMYETGCRAEEINIIRVTWFRPQSARVVIPAEHAKGYRVKKNPKPRVIFLNARALAIATANAARDPIGTLFTNKRGRPWTAYAVNCAFSRLQETLGKKYCATLFRHSFITNALKNGVNPTHVAKLVGHSDLKMIMQVYEHLDAEGEILAASLEQATATPTAKSSAEATAV
jgi:integrase